MALHVYNRTPHKGINFEVPLTRLNKDKKLHLDKVKRFGCVAYAKVPKPATKFSNVAIRTFLVGFTDMGYIVWHPETLKFIETRHVRFNEKLVYKDIFKVKENDLEELDFSADDEEVDQQLEQTENMEVNAELENNDLNDNVKKPKQQNPENKRKRKANNNKGQEDQEPVRKQPKRATTINRKTWTHLRLAESRELEDISEKPQNEEEQMHIFIARTNRDPINFKEAMESVDQKSWSNAMNLELDSMEENHVWIIVSRPKIGKNGKKPNIIDSKWVYKRKIGPDGVELDKARLVIRRFKDKNEYALMETYAPVSSLSAVRAVLATINHEGWDARQMDVKTAFLNSELDDNEVIYMQIPEGYNCDEEFKRDNVCLLKRSIYGLKISSKKWYQNFAKEVEKLGFQRDVNQPCLFTWRHQGKVVVIILYVDDFLIAGNDRARLEEVESKLCSK